MSNCKVYCLQEPNSEIVRYVGITSNRLEKRFSGHLSEKGNTHKVRWITSLKRKGLRPDMELIEDGLTFEEALKKEVEYIRLFKACGARLVNGTIGGEGSMGRVYAKESYKKISELLKAKTGNKNPFFGRKHTEESNRKNGEKAKMLGNWKYATAVSRITNRKPVVQYDLQGNPIREFDSITEAAKAVSKAATNISASCRGKKNAVGGFIWKYKNAA